MRIYGHQMREEAFDLYCKGLSSCEIAKELEAQHGRDGQPAGSTVRSWVKKYGWRQRRSQLQGRVEQRTDERRVDELTRLVARFEEVRERILEATLKLEPKSAEGAVRSLATVQGMITRMTQPREEHITRDQLRQIVAIVIEGLEQDAVLSARLREKQAELIAYLEGKMAAEE
jgi:hypothetical protein